MSKKSSRKRRKKLARPPKSKRPRGARPGAPEVAPPDLEPSGNPELPGGIHPSLLQSKRYQNFVRKCERIREAVDERKERFGLRDIGDPKLRTWLAKLRRDRESGMLSAWKTAQLDQIGFDWQPPERTGKTTARPRAEPKRPRWEAVYSAQLELLQAQACGPLESLFQLEESEFRWWRNRLLSLRHGRLEPSKEAFLEASGLPLDALAKSRSLNAWRERFRQIQELRKAGRSPSTAEGEAKRRLRTWLTRQARAFQAGTLDEWQIQLLENAGVDWAQWFPENQRQAKLEAGWARKLEAYLELEARHGRPPPNAVLKSSGLISWVGRMRQRYRKGRLSPELIADYERRGFVFDQAAARAARLDARWDAFYARLLAFRERYGHSRVPSSFREDPELGDWLRQQRERLVKGKLAKDKASRLHTAGVTAHVPKDEGAAPTGTQLSAWLKAYERLKRHLDAKEQGRAPDSLSRLPPKLAAWLSRQRRHLQADRLEGWQIEALRKLDFDPACTHEKVLSAQSERTFRGHLEKIREFVEREGHGHIPRSHPDQALVSFIGRKRAAHNKGSLRQEELDRLREAGLCLNPQAEPSPAWMRNYRRLRDYHARHGDSRVPRKYPPDQALADYCAQERQRARKGRLLAVQIDLLNELGFHWVDGPPRPKDG